MKDFVIDIAAAQVKSRLEAAGYSNVQDVKNEGDHFDAWATAKDGKRVFWTWTPRLAPLRRFLASRDTLRAGLSSARRDRDACADQGGSVTV